MKWITHQTAGVGAALALHLPLEGVVAACLGAILPDKLDQAIAKRSRNPQRTFNQIHRGHHPLVRLVGRHPAGGLQPSGAPALAARPAGHRSGRHQPMWCWTC